MTALTPQQRTAAELIARGSSQRDVARRLNRARSTVAAWTQREDFRDLVAALAAKKSPAAPNRAPKPAPAPAAQPTDIDFAKHARTAAQIALAQVVNRHRSGEEIPIADVAKLVGVLEKFTADDAGMSPEAVAAQLANDSAFAGAVVDQLDVRTAAGLHTALKTAEIKRLEQERHLDVPAVRAAFTHFGRWASPEVAGQWLRRWEAVMALSREDLDRLLSLAAHHEVAAANGDPPDPDAVNHRYPLATIEKVIAAADPRSEKDQTR